MESDNTSKINVNNNAANPLDDMKSWINSAEIVISTIMPDVQANAIKLSGSDGLKGLFSDLQSLKKELLIDKSVNLNEFSTKLTNFKNRLAAFELELSNKLKEKELTIQIKIMEPIEAGKAQVAPQKGHWHYTADVARAAATAKFNESSKKMQVLNQQFSKTANAALLSQGDIDKLNTAVENLQKLCSSSADSIEKEWGKFKGAAGELMTALTNSDPASNIQPQSGDVLNISNLSLPAKVFSSKEGKTDAILNQLFRTKADNEGNISLSQILKSLDAAATKGTEQFELAAKGNNDARQYLASTQIALKTVYNTIKETINKTTQVAINKNKDALEHSFGLFAKISEMNKEIGEAQGNLKYYQEKASSLSEKENKKMLDLFVKNFQTRLDQHVAERNNMLKEALPAIQAMMTDSTAPATKLSNNPHFQHHILIALNDIVQKTKNKHLDPEIVALQAKVGAGGKKDSGNEDVLDVKMKEYIDQAKKENVRTNEDLSKKGKDKVKFNATLAAFTKFEFDGTQCANLQYFNAHDVEGQLTMPLTSDELLKSIEPGITQGQLPYRVIVAIATGYLQKDPEDSPIKSPLKPLNGLKMVVNPAKFNEYKKKLASLSAPLPDNAQNDLLLNSYVAAFTQGKTADVSQKPVAAPTPDIGFVPVVKPEKKPSISDIDRKREQVEIDAKKSQKDWKLQQIAPDVNETIIDPEDEDEFYDLLNQSVVSINDNKGGGLNKDEKQRLSELAAKFQKMTGKDVLQAFPQVKEEVEKEVEKRTATITTELKKVQEQKKEISQKLESTKKELAKALTPVEQAMKEISTHNWDMDAGFNFLVQHRKEIKGSWSEACTQLAQKASDEMPTSIKKTGVVRKALDVYKNKF